MTETIIVDHYLQNKLAVWQDLESESGDYTPAICNCDWKFCPFNSSMREAKNIIAVSPDIFQTMEILITTQN